MKITINNSFDMKNSEHKAQVKKTYNSPLNTKTFNINNSLSDRFIPYSISTSKLIKTLKSKPNPHIKKYYLKNYSKHLKHLRQKEKLIFPYRNQRKNHHHLLCY